MDKFRTVSEDTFVYPDPKLTIPVNGATQTNRTLDFQVNLAKNVVLYDFGNAYIMIRGKIGKIADWTDVEKTYPRPLSATYVQNLSLELGGTPIYNYTDAGSIARVTSAIYGSNSYKNSVEETELNTKDVLDVEGDTNDDKYRKAIFNDRFVISLKHFPVFKELADNQKFIGNTYIRIVLNLKLNDNEILYSTRAADHAERSLGRCYFYDAKLVVPKISFTNKDYYHEYVSQNLLNTVRIPYLGYNTISKYITTEPNTSVSISTKQKDIRQIFAVFYQNTVGEADGFGAGRYYSAYDQRGNANAIVQEIKLETTPGDFLPPTGYKSTELVKPYLDLMKNVGYTQAIELQPISYNTWKKRNCTFGFDLRGMYGDGSFSTPNLEVVFDKAPNAGDNQKPVQIYVVSEVKNTLVMTNYDGEFVFKTESA